MRKFIFLWLIVVLNITVLCSEKEDKGKKPIIVLDEEDEVASSFNTSSKLYILVI